MPAVSGGTRLQSGASPKKKNAIIIVSAVVGALILLYLSFCIVATKSVTVLPRTELLGYDVSGMDKARLRSFLDETLPAAYDEQGFTVTLDEQEVARVTLTDLHLQPETETATAICFAPGHSGRFFRDGWDYTLSLLRGNSLVPELRVTDASVAAAAGIIAGQVNCAPMPLSCRIDENDLSHLYFRAPSRGIVADENALRADLRAALADGELRPIPCRYTATPYDESVTLDLLAAGFHEEAKNASYDPKTEEIAEAYPGIIFDKKTAEAVLAELHEGEEAAVDATITLPKVYAAELETCLFRDLLASYSTKFTGTSDRIQNVILAAGAINGTVLNSGDVFSYNRSLGERTSAKGYREAPAYIAGETVDTVGGGICQTSSTLYAACLLANLKIVSRTAHRYVCSYIPYGLDATVSWPDLDYQFCNSTDYPLKIVTVTTGGKITVYLYGTKTESGYVRMTSETLSTTGYSTVYEESEDLAPGATEVKQTPYTGRVVRTYRNVYDGTGQLISSTLEAESNYKYRDEIILYGKGGPNPGEPAMEPVHDPLLEEPDDAMSELGDPFI